MPANARPNELVQFDDYREIAPGLWLPFRETRTVPRTSQSVKGKQSVMRTELRVKEVRTDRSLAERCAELLPKGGEQVHDQRFAVPVDFQYRADRTDEDIRRMAEAEHQKRARSSRGEKEDAIGNN
jgi:hypothetical protein